MKVAVLGTGGVGQALASRLVQLGHEVMVGTRNVAEKLASNEKDHFGNPPFSQWLADHKNVNVGTFTEAAAFGELIINATLGAISLKILNMAGTKNLKNKILIDVANPLDFSQGMPPFLLEGLCNTHSLGEEIQKNFPEVRVVKTLNTMWSGLMINPQMLDGGNHTNFICGNDSEAKSVVTSLLKEFGWSENNILDLGNISASRGTEGLLLAWGRIWGVKQTGPFNFKIAE